MSRALDIAGAIFIVLITLAAVLVPSRAIEADLMVGFGSGIACAVAHDAVQTEVKSAIPAPTTRI